MSPGPQQQTTRAAIACALVSGASQEDVQREIIDPTGGGAEEKAALWLYAHALRAGSASRIRAEAGERWGECWPRPGAGCGPEEGTGSPNAPSGLSGATVVLVRCPVCRSATPLMVIWAAGDACPTCGRTLAVPDRGSVTGRPGGEASITESDVGLRAGARASQRLRRRGSAAASPASPATLTPAGPGPRPGSGRRRAGSR